MTTKTENHETHLVSLFIDNDEGTYSYFKEIADQLLSEMDQDDAVPILADAIEGHFDEAMESMEIAPGLEDLFRHALSEVDFYSIAEGFLEQ